eukprot:m.144404 g.144404  ORF g.144404 m.144404 type:complete len:57 (+) comp16195_c0_seq1:215-385(+)
MSLRVHLDYFAALLLQQCNANMMACSLATVLPFILIGQPFRNPTRIFCFQAGSNIE